MSDSKKSTLAYCGLFAVAIFWGLAFVAVKSALDTVPPVYLIAIRFSIAALGMMIFFPGQFKKMNRKSVLHGIVVGICLFLAYFTQTIGCQYTTAGKNAFLTALYIMVVPLVNWVLTKKRPSLRLFVAVFIAFIGIGFISLDNDFSINIGDLLTIICGVLFALQIAFLDLYLEKDDVVVMTTLELTVTGLLGWITAPFIDGGFSFGIITKEAWGSLLYLGFISSLLCNLMQTLCQKYTKPGNAALIMSCESLFGALGSAVFLHEVMEVKSIFGCGLMMVAILIAQLKIQK